ncbi:MAG: LamG-like jellyroll fold domain-containing protein [Planctomycetota bacterium]|jgi:hypothetical protein
MGGRIILLAAIVLVGGNSVLADAYTWTNADPGNDSWCNQYNWDPTDIPGDTDGALIGLTSPDRGPIIGIGCNIDVGDIDGPNPADGHTQVVDVNTSGTVEVGSWLWRTCDGTGIINFNGSPTVTIDGGPFRGTDNGVSIINISGDPTITIAPGEAYDLRGADGSGLFYINMSGGYLDCGNDLIFGDNGGGELNVSGGAILIRRDLNLGPLRGAEPITVNMTQPGGSVRVRGKFFLPGNADRAGSVRLNLYAGSIDCNALVHGGADDPPTYTDDWRIDIEEGTLEIKGDVRAAIDANVTAEQITAYDGAGTVVVELIDGNTLVTALPPDPNCALNPDPPHRSENVDPNVVLGWMPGIGATSHDVYFGTSFDDVNDATTGDSAYLDNVDVNHYPESDVLELELDTTYYWRIDEVGDGGPWKSRTWTFTTRSAIIDPNMLLWYRFDEPNGAVAADSSGYGNHGVVDGNELLWAPDEGHYGGCRTFDDDGDVETVISVPASILHDIDGGITVSVWLKDNYENSTDNWVFDTGTGGSTGSFHMYAAVLSIDRQVLWRAGNDANDVLRWGLKRRAGWRHFVFVKDESQDKMSIYFDGELATSRTGVDDTLVNVRDKAFKIGAANWENYSYEGKMDDFRIYDRALSDNQITALFRGGDVELAWAPSPGDFDHDVPRDAVLTWKPGDYAVQHDVYLGTAWDDVNDAGTLSAEYKGRQDLDANCYDPCGLDLEATYYWRIDEVNGIDVWKGRVWQFTVGNFLVVDDMETYDIIGNLLFETWDDGFNNWTGSQLALEYGTNTIVHGGGQSMKFGYNNGLPWANHSEIDANTTGGQGNLQIGKNWTFFGERSLTLFFHGSADNDAGQQMYVVLEDSLKNLAVVKYGDDGEDMNDIREQEWQEWNIPLHNFNTPDDIDETDVNKVRIGFGDRDNPQPGGSGAVFFDDIRLYLPRCIPSIVKPDADFSGNCIVDLADVAIMAAQWLRTDAYLAATDPGDNGLVGWWNLDENAGSTANDSSAYANHGSISGSYSWVAGHDDVNSAVQFANGKVFVPDALQLKPSAQVSASAWVYYSGDPGDSARVVVKGKDNYEAYCIEIGENTVTYYVGDVNGKRYFADGNEHDIWGDEWVHLAGTYDGSIVKCYVNGQVVGTEQADSIPLSQDPCGLGIGNRSDADDQPLHGAVDDVRVYDRALSAAEIAWLATDGAGYVPLRSPLNLYDKEISGQAINFRDYAVLMASWLEKKLWPPE